MAYTITTSSIIYNKKLNNGSAQAQNYTVTKQPEKEWMTERYTAFEM